MSTIERDRFASISIIEAFIRFRCDTVAITRCSFLQIPTKDLLFDFIPHVKTIIWAFK